MTAGHPLALGAHQSIADGLHTCILRGYLAGCDVVQIFTKSNHQWRARSLPIDEVDWFLAHVQTFEMPVTCSHASYLINLGSPDRDLNRKSYRAFRVEVERCDLLQIPNLVFHPGAHVGSGLEAGMRRIADNLNRLCDDLPDSTTGLCLEGTAGAGSTVGSRFEELAGIAAQVSDQRRIGICLDTCHLFAAGYPLVDPADWDRTVRDFDSVVGLDRLRVIHLNDSVGDCGSRKDRHAHIGKGRIGRAGFRNVVTDERLRHLPMILETPKGDDLSEDVANIKTLRSLSRTLNRGHHRNR